MLFNSYLFIFAFLPLVLVLTTMARRFVGLSFALFILIVASVIFYGWHRPEILALLLGSIFGNYLLTGLAVRALPKSTTRRLWTIVAIVANLALLFTFKYFNFFIDNVETVTGASWDFEQIVLPIGISFYTFQQIAYCADTYAGKVENRNFLSYALFVAFFPQLIAGPIVHHSHVIRQFESSRFGNPSLDDLFTGLAIFSVGLFKKKIIADTFASYATPIFVLADGGGNVDFVQAWQGALAYTFQIYFDFSGYSDMALGLACMFGVRLPMNFFSPYKSTSIIEFWRRWHMTLSQFLRDYLYIPLGGNRKGPIRRWLNLSITMLLGGLWHGASWNFVIWGGLHGLYLGINHAWNSVFGKPDPNHVRPWPIAAGRTVIFGGLTFLAVVIAWVLFRAVTLQGAGEILGGMATPWAGAPLAEQFAAVDLQFWGWLIGASLITFLAPNTMEIFSRVRISIEEVKPTKAAWLLPIVFRPTIGWLIIAAAIAGFAVFYESPTTEFLYWQF
ncbi:MAG: MBOAT family O-acyltransferase [Pseudomonadota bacterium]